MGDKKQVTRSLSERIGELEHGVARVLVGINERFQRNDNRLGLLEETTTALVQLQGPEDVNAYIQAQRDERNAAQSAAEKASLDQAIADGYALPAEKCEEKSLIVVRYLRADGSVVPPGRAQLVVPGVDAKYQPLILGKGIGTTFDVGQETKCELMEIYNIDEAKAKAVMEAKAKAQAEAAATAAAEQAAKDEQKDTGQPAVEKPADIPGPSTAPAEAAAAPEAQ